MTSIPEQVGPYEIRSEIGRGGMGVVYLAHDTKLDRPVAIKVLPADLSGDQERLARFEREARLLASLNHANVASVYGLEVHDEVRYLVLEYVDGEDLSDRLAGGPLPVDEALHIGKQIARAVEAAHAKGVIHRDLKPANVKVTVDGDVKVLDFGLAKALHDQPAAADGLVDSPTVVPSHSPTIPGVILGTAGYMSPEQARGRPIDKRSDIWSFGCILYEMLTGKCPFPGESVAESLGATIHKEPDWDALPAATPASVRLLLHRCLQKDRSRRLQDIGDARVELDDTLSGTTRMWTTDVAVADASPSRWPGLPWLALTTVLLVAAVGVTIMFTRPAPAPARVVRAFVPPPEGMSFVPDGDEAGPVVISPDGRTLAFTAMGAGQTRSIWIRPLDVSEARRLAGTENANFPFWSADGRSLGFFADGLLKRVELDGGSPITICEARAGRGGTWNADGDILFAPDFEVPIHRVAATGGRPVPVTTVDTARHTSHRWPAFLPDGRHFLYSAIHSESSRAADNAIYFASLDGDADREVIRSSLNAEAIGDELLFVRRGTLMAAPFDPETGTLNGDPEAVASSVAYNLATWKADFSGSPAGVIAYNRGGLVKGEGTKIVTYDRGGNQLKVVSQPTSSGTLRVSPDGKRLSYITGRASSSMDAWVYDIARDLPMRLTFFTGLEDLPVWTPDGRELFFSYWYATGSSPVEGIYRVPAGGGSPSLVLAGKPDEGLRAEDMSPDGRYLLFSKWGADKTDDDVWILPLDPPGRPVPMIQTPSIWERDARFSPDGRWIMYGSDESGVEEIYAVPFVAPPPDADRVNPPAKWQLSNGGGDQPRWSPDGTEAFFLSTGETLMAVKVNASDGRLDPGPAEPLFPLHLGFGNNFEVMPDGTFVATLPEETSERPVALILNWRPKPDR